MSKKFVLSILGALLLGTALAFGGFGSVVHAATLSPHQVSTLATPAKADACPATIRDGSTGSSVKNLQESLNLYYDVYYTDTPYSFKYPLAVDGDFGGQTYNAVRDYQNWNGLSVDGVVGPKTWASLGYC